MIAARMVSPFATARLVRKGGEILFLFVRGALGLEIGALIQALDLSKTRRAPQNQWLSALAVKDQYAATVNTADRIFSL